MAMSPAVAGSASATTPITAANAIGALQGGGEGGAQQDQIQQLASQVREASAAVDEIGATNPALASEVTQIKQILRQMLVKAASVATAQNPSSLQVPMGEAP